MWYRARMVDITTGTFVGDVAAVSCWFECGYINSMLACVKFWLPSAMEERARDQQEVVGLTRRGFIRLLGALRSAKSSSLPSGFSSSLVGFLFSMLARTERLCLYLYYNLEICVMFCTCAVSALSKSLCSGRESGSSLAGFLFSMHACSSPTTNKTLQLY